MDVKRIAENIYREMGGQYADPELDVARWREAVTEAREYIAERAA